MIMTISFIRDAVVQVWQRRLPGPARLPSSLPSLHPLCSGQAYFMLLCLLVFLCLQLMFRPYDRPLFNFFESMGLCTLVAVQSSTLLDHRISDDFKEGLGLLLSTALGVVGSLFLYGALQPVLLSLYKVSTRRLGVAKVKKAQGKATQKPYEVVGGGRREEGEKGDGRVRRVERLEGWCHRRLWWLNVESWPGSQSNYGMTESKATMLDVRSRLHSDKGKPQRHRGSWFF